MKAKQKLRIFVKKYKTRFSIFTDFSKISKKMDFRKNNNFYNLREFHLDKAFLPKGCL